MKLLSFLFPGLLLLSMGSLIAQEDQAAVEAKLRESLRGAMLQLRNIEAERARLEAELGVLTTQSERQVKDLNAKLEESLKSAAEEKTLADKQIAEQEKKLEAEKARTAAFAAALDKWKASYFQITEIARTKEAERARLLDKTMSLQNTVADRERRNLELYGIGKEILERYENFAFGKALLAREPFTGLAKVKLEEQVQDYKDKLTDGVVREGDSATPAQ
jgi:DNA-binding MltR family transcriptional regulator